MVSFLWDGIVRLFTTVFNGHNEAERPERTRTSVELNNSTDVLNDQDSLVNKFAEYEASPDGEGSSSGGTLAAWSFDMATLPPRTVAEATIENEALQVHIVSLRHLAERECFHRFLIEDEVASWKREAERWKAAAEMASRRYERFCRAAASEEADLEEGAVNRIEKLSRLEDRLASDREQHVDATRGLEEKRRRLSHSK